MLDLAMIGAAGALFVLAAVYVRGCQWLLGDRPDRHEP
jgi:hypothetical protein